MKSFHSQYDLVKNKVTIYRRTSQGSKYQSESWYGLFRLTGKDSVRRSLRTNDQSEAERRAEEIYWDLTNKSKRGLSLNRHRFELVCNNYLKEFANRVKMEESLLNCIKN
jgi:hypothetical protein